MMPEPSTTWAAGLLDAGESGTDDLEEAQRRVAILRVELEAIRAGRKEATATELRRLERDYRDAVTKVGELQRMRPQALPRAPTGAIRGPITRPPAEPGAVGAVTGGAMGVTTPRGYAAPPTMQQPTISIGQRLQNLWQGRIQALPGERPIDTVFGATAAQYPGIMGQPPAAGLQAGIQLPAGMRALGEYFTPGVGAGGIAAPAGTAGDYALIDPFFASLTPEQQQQYLALKLGGMSEYQQAQIGLQQPGPMTDYEKAMMAWRMQGLAQEQSTAGATAAYRQQQLAAQQAQQQAQLQQAWAIAQQELAHAQNVMASQIGTQVGQVQSQIWAQGLPHALPQGTTVAPGFERGGPMQQLYRMGGARFTPGVTGRISPQPGPSQQDLMGWVQQAMQKYGAGG